MLFTLSHIYSNMSLRLGFYCKSSTAEIMRLLRILISMFHMRHCLLNSLMFFEGCLEYCPSWCNLYIKALYLTTFTNACKINKTRHRWRDTINTTLWLQLTMLGVCSSVVWAAEFTGHRSTLCLTRLSLWSVCWVAGCASLCQDWSTRIMWSLKLQFSWLSSLRVVIIPTGCCKEYNAALFRALSSSSGPGYILRF